jgi:hypothetical protein
VTRRAGISLDQLEPEATAPLRLFADDCDELLQRLMMALDFCNLRWGAGAVRLGLFPSSTRWQTRARHPAPGYTTRWGDVMVTG